MTKNDILKQWEDSANHGTKVHEEIENYIKTEADEFVNFNVRLCEEMPPLLERIEDGEVKVYKRREDN